MLKGFSDFTSLLFTPRYSIVYRYIPKRSPFDKTGFIDDYVPRPNKYPKSRKPRLTQWDDPSVTWPHLIPRSTKDEGKALIKSLERREKLFIERSRNFSIPDFRAGDVVQFKYLHSISEGRGNYYTGICIGRSRKNEIDATFKVVFRFGGVEVVMNVKQNSPFLSDFKLVARGSGNHRSKLNYVAELGLTKEQLLKPMIKHNTMRRRKEDGVLKKIKESDPKESKLDASTDPLLD